MKEYKTASGVVISAKRCWWLKINTKPVRTHALDGAVFPYRVTVRYSAEGREFESRGFVVWKIAVPSAGQRVAVRYDARRPGKALKILPENKEIK